MHDEKQFADHAALYAAALSARGFNPQGLYRGVVADEKPVLCAACHSSEALGAQSYGSIPSLTASVHLFPNLGTGTVTVTRGPFSVAARAMAPPVFPSGWPAPFAVAATPINVQAAPAFDRDFGDGSVYATNQYAIHTYDGPGNYNWRVISKVESGTLQSTVTNASSILIEAPAVLSASVSGNTISLSWPAHANALVEHSASLGPDAHWTVCPEAITSGNGVFSVVIPHSEGISYYRLRKL